MLSSFRIRIGNISSSATQRHFPLWKWGTETHKPPLLLATSTARTTTNRISDGWGIVAHLRRKVPIGYNGAPHIRPQKVPLPVDRSSNPTIVLIAGPVRPTTPNGIRIRSAVFPQCTGQTDGRTDRPTDRQWESLMTIGRYASNESDEA